MKATLDRLALAEANHRAQIEAGHSQARRTLLLAAGALMFCFGIMPLAYGLLTGGSNLMGLKGPISGHILPNCGANALVMLGALLVVGRLDRKLTAVLTLVLIVHGALAFLILTTRSPYSNQIMLMAVPASAFLGAALMYMKHRLAPLRVALLGPDDASIGQVRVAYDRIRDPAVDLRSYDVLLTTSVIDLSPEWAKVLSGAMIAGKPVRHVAEHMEESQGIVSVDHFDLDHLPAMGMTSYRTRKRLMDIGILFAVLPVALPVLVAGIMAVLISMGRPIFFVQPRTGQGGKVFNIYKLRTMRVAGENQGTATITGDPRITAVGAVLRRFRVDELPQLLNVLKGDMSIIGPRPEWTLLSERYSRDFPVYVYRHLVRPGITGWAQVRGGYASDLIETRTKVGYDLFYIKNLSFSLDLQILVRTVWTLLRGSGAR